MTADIVQRHQPRSPDCVQLFIRGELLPNSCHRTIGFPYIELARPSGQSKKAAGQMNRMLGCALLLGRAGGDRPNLGLVIRRTMLCHADSRSAQRYAHKAIEDHLVAKIVKLDHFDQRAVDARVILEHDHKRIPEKAFSCSIRLSVRGPDLFAEDRDENLYAAIDKVAKKIEGQIRKRHNKSKARHHNEASKTKHKLKERGL
jgi:putative sigma-54 modulation protein